MEDLAGKLSQFTTQESEQDDNVDKSTDEDNMERRESLEDYDFSHVRRGTALIFSFSRFKDGRPREGADIEALNIKQLLECFDFDVLVSLNKTTEEVKDVVREAASKDHSGEDCFCCFLMSHGDEMDYGEYDVEIHDIIQTYDGHISMEDVMLPFRDDRCPSLAGKPRLFFVQACRGSKAMYKVPIIERSQYETHSKRSQTEVTDAAILENEGVCQHENTSISCWDSSSANKADGQVGRTTEIHSFGSDVDEFKLNKREADIDRQLLVTTSTREEANLSSEDDGVDDDDRVTATSGIEDEASFVWAPIPILCLKHPCYRDFLFAYSTIPGYAAFRNEKRSWFLYQLFCKLKNLSNEFDLMDILQAVNHAVAYDHYDICILKRDQSKAMVGQIPWIMSALTRRVCLRPKENKKKALEDLHWLTNDDFN